MLETSRRTSVESMTMSETVVYAFTESPTCWYPKFFTGFVDGLFGYVHIIFGAWLVKALSTPIRRLTIIYMEQGNAAIITAGLLLLPAFLLRDLKLIVPLSVLGNMITIAFFISLIVKRFKIHEAIIFPSLFNCQLQSLLFVGLSLLTVNSFGVVCNVCVCLSIIIIHSIFDS